MASTAAPYGLRPVNLLGGRPYAGATRAFKIASGYATNIFNGSIVTLKSTGYLEVLITNTGGAGDLFAPGTSGAPIGVFVGCEYTDPSLGYKIQSQYWPTGTVASDAVGFVVDDPHALFMAQSAGSIAQAELGMNVGLNAVQSTSTGSTTTGNSTSALGAAAVATTGVAFKIVDFVESTTSTAGDDYTDVIVKFNAGVHAYDNPLGNSY